jgi:hypothetical protein
MNELPNAERPGQYVAFFCVQMNTKEGPGFIFLAADAFSRFVFHIGVEKDESAESVLKAVYLLSENPDFLRHRDKGFTLVFEKYEELSERIKAIISHINGTHIYNKKYNNNISNPVLKGLLEFMTKSK